MGDHTLGPRTPARPPEHVLLRSIGPNDKPFPFAVLSVIAGERPPVPTLEIRDPAGTARAIAYLTRDDGDRPGVFLTWGAGGSEAGRSRGDLREPAAVLILDRAGNAFAAVSSECPPFDLLVGSDRGKTDRYPVQGPGAFILAGRLWLHL